MANLIEHDQDAMTWTDLHGSDEKPLGIKAGVLTADVIGQLHFVDGWSVNYTTPQLMREDGATLGMRASDGTVVPPYPALLVNLPDYPREGAATYLIGLDDARRFARLILSTCDEAERDLRRFLRPRAKRTVPAAPPPCSIENCNRSRHYFDESGAGYCKRHAEELGIRPKGKVV